VRPDDSHEFSRQTAERLRSRFIRPAGRKLRRLLLDISGVDRDGVLKRA